MPAVARNPAITAMEIATLCELAPGRFLPGIGHGVQSWMEQMGALTPSPLTTLEETIVAVRRLLAGENVTMHGRARRSRRRAARPATVDRPAGAGGRARPEVAADGGSGGRRDRAGRAGQPVVRHVGARTGRSPYRIDWAESTAEFHVAVFSALCVQDDRESAFRIMAPWLAGLLEDPNVAFRALPFFDDLLARFAEHGVEGLVTMPAEWWIELAPIGTLDDARAHVDALERAGVNSIGLFPAPEVDIARLQIDDVLAIARR